MTSTEKLSVILKTEFTERKTRNSRYSLRAFSKYLGLDVSVLSRLINQKIPISLKLLNKLHQKGLFDRQTFLHFQEIIVKERVDPKNKWGLDSFFNEDELDKFKLIQEWHFLAIIELLQLKDFEFSEVSIAKKLGLSQKVAKEAISKLKRLKIVTLTKDKKWKATLGYQALLEKNLFALAMKERQKEILQKAALDVLNLKDDEFEQCSFCFSIDEELMPEAKKRMHEFKKKLAKDLSKKSKKKNRVYEFSISLFPLSN